MKKEFMTFAIILLFISLCKSEITGNIIFQENPNELQEIYSKNLPSLVKINVFYDYEVFIPKLNKIEYKRSFDYLYPNYKDMVVDSNSNQNGFEDFFGDSLWNEFYVGEYLAVDEEGHTYTYNMTAEDINLEKEYLNSIKEFPDSTGTGFFIKSDGYILTNAHVVTLLDNELEEITEQVKGYYTTYYYDLYTNSNYNEEISQKKFDDYLQKILYLEENLKIKNLRIKKIEIIQGEGTNAQNFSAEVIDFNENYLDEIGGRDWALIKVGGNNFPSVKIGDSDKVAIGDDLIIMGYPWTSEGYTGELQSAYIAPTPTYGKVSNLVPSGKYKDIQLDISAENGNSGGPGINKNNEVIGVLVSGYEGLSGSYNYLIPINDITKELDLELESDEQKLEWENALEKYWAKDYSGAKRITENLISEESNNPYLLDLKEQIGDKVTDIKPNEFPVDTKGFQYNFTWVVILMGLIILVLLGIIIRSNLKHKSEYNYKVTTKKKRLYNREN